MHAPATIVSARRRQSRRTIWMTHTAANAATPTNATALLNSMPTQTETERATSPHRDHCRSSREVSARVSSAVKASAVYCFRSLRTSIAGTSSTPIAATSPAATDATSHRQPIRRANQ